MKKIMLIGVLAIITLFILVVTISGLKTSECDKSDAQSTNQPVQSHRSYKLVVCNDVSKIQPGVDTEITYLIRNDQGKTIRNFAIVHEKIMHFIVIRKDLQHFQHLHPIFDIQTGRFAVTVNFPTDGPYRLFPDFTPDKSEDNPQLLPVTVDKDVSVGDLGKYKAVVNKPDNETAQVVGDYVVNFTLPPIYELKAGKNFIYGISVRKNQKPVRDLQPYLGAMGHSVILKDGNLNFIHTHALEGAGINAVNEKIEHSIQMGGQAEQMNTNPPTNSAGQVNFATRLPEPGIYKIFVQFQHQGKVLTAVRTIEVR